MEVRIDMILVIREIDHPMASRSVIEISRMNLWFMIDKQLHNLDKTGVGHKIDIDHKIDMDHKKGEEISISTQMKGLIKIMTPTNKITQKLRVV